MTFPARFESRCETCWETINRGEIVTYNGRDEVVHAACMYREPVERPVVHFVESWTVAGYTEGGKLFRLTDCPTEAARDAELERLRNLAHVVDINVVEVL